MTGLDIVAKRIPKKVMEQYETIRSSGITNMFDYYTVIQVVGKLQLDELKSLSLVDYKTLLLNFGKLMKHYNIKQA